MRKRFPSRIVIVVGLFAIGLSGCTLTSVKTAEPSPAKIVTATPSAVPIPKPALGLVATGQFVDYKGRPNGTLTVTFDGEFWMNVADYTADYPDPLFITLISDTVDVGACIAYKHGTSWDFSGPREAKGFPIARPGFMNDPSFYRTVVIFGADDDRKVGNCSEPIRATAQLTWTIPDPYPDLSVKDSGERTGALGTVTSPNGVPETYGTVRGDTWSAMAARFGLSMDELTYLNPIRPWAGDKLNVAYEYEVLNLNPENR